MDFKRILKWLSRIFGNFLLSLSITLFIFSFFASAFFNNLNSLKNNLVNELSSDDVLSEVLKVDISKTRELCKLNPNLDECKQLDNIKDQFSDNPELNNLLNKTKSYSKYIFSLRLAALIFFVLGFLFIFLGSEFSLLNTGEKVSLSIAISGLSSAIFYKILPVLVDSTFNSSAIQEKLKDFPPLIVDKVKIIVFDWMNLLINSVFKVAVILAVVFAVVFIGLKIYKKKKLS